MQATAVTAGLLINEPATNAVATDVGATIVLAHGAGAPMDSPFMNAIASGLAAGGVRAVRFEFPYMEERRRGGRRRPPDPMRVLEATWLEQVSRKAPGKLVIGGKSMGGRVASMVADKAGVEIIGLTRRGRRLPGLARIAEIKAEVDRMVADAVNLTESNDVLDLDPEALDHASRRMAGLLAQASHLAIGLGGSRDIAPDSLRRSQIR